ncbi:hypothetical protein JTB14_002952 [Gonioctena quinquepunctata]|nr:hypothetical protein JTB14_002952 [Gonioctena quinquepunctata]
MPENGRYQSRGKSWTTSVPVPRPRLKRGKDQWDKFAAQLDKVVRWIPPVSSNYNRFAKAIITTAKKYIPRGFRREYVPGWNAETEQIYQEFQNSGDSEIADELLNRLDTDRLEK